MAYSRSLPVIHFKYSSELMLIQTPCLSLPRSFPSGNHEFILWVCLSHFSILLCSSHLGHFKCPSFPISMRNAANPQHSTLLHFSALQIQSSHCNHPLISLTTELQVEMQTVRFVHRKNPGTSCKVFLEIQPGELHGLSWRCDTPSRAAEGNEH